MKLALIDNMNNNFFSIARYLRDAGLEVDLYTIPGANDHFNPQSDTFEDINSLTWIKRFPIAYYRYRSLVPQIGKSLEVFKHYDLLIACGLAMAVLRRYGIGVDIFIPYGSDLYILPFCLRVIKGIKITKWIYALPYFWCMSYCQGKAIQDARVIITNSRHKMYKEALDKLDRKCLNIGLPMVYGNYSFPPFKEWDFLKEHDFVVFNHSRHIWASNPDNLEDFSTHLGNKRNDKLLRAFSRFVKVTRFRSPLLVTFEYGPDVEQSKKLTKELHIEDYVKWMPLSDRKFIMAGLRHSTIGVDQLREGLSGIGGTGYQVMASGVPLITYTNGATADPTHPFFQAPIIDTHEEEKIFLTFRDYETNPAKYKELGIASKKWFNENLGMGLAKKFVKLFQLLAENKKITSGDPQVIELFT